MAPANTALNLIWLLCCLGVGVYYVRQEVSRSTTRWARLCRTLAIAAACLVLFPSVSASDDSVRLRFLEEGRSQTPKHGVPTRGTPQESQATLVRLLDALESLQVSEICLFAAPVGFSFVNAETRYAGRDAYLLRRPGRAPPSLLF